MKKLILTLLLVPVFAIAADKTYLECGTTQYTMEPDKNECSTAGSDYSLGISKSVCFRWDPDNITITESTEMSKYVYVKMVFTTLVNRETLEMTKSSYSAGSDGVDTTEPYSAGVCKIVEKNTKNKL
jgi:hypothetical protein